VVDSRVAGWAAAGPISTRECYSGVAETSVYVGDGFRAGSAVLLPVFALAADPHPCQGRAVLLGLAGAVTTLPAVVVVGRVVREFLRVAGEARRRRERHSTLVDLFGTALRRHPDVAVLDRAEAFAYSLPGTRVVPASDNAQLRRADHVLHRGSQSPGRPQPPARGGDLRQGDLPDPSPLTAADGERSVRLTGRRVAFVGRGRQRCLARGHRVTKRAAAYAEYMAKRSPLVGREVERGRFEAAFDRCRREVGSPRRAFP
jgi:hypothetical protein